MADDCGGAAIETPSGLDHRDADAGEVPEFLRLVG
jgi:hypothetical protein